MASARKYWLMKSEPDVFSIDDLQKHGKTAWEGVRNYQARNYMRDEMRVGDLVLFYHSNAAPPGVAGVARVCKQAYPDASAQEPRSPYYDPKATPSNPIWMMVEVAFVSKFTHFVRLDRLKREAAVANMLVLRRGMRLSVQPVERAHFEHVVALGREADALD